MNDLSMLYRLLFIAVLFQTQSVYAGELTIEITQGTEKAVPIAVVPFGWKGTSAQAPEKVHEVIKADLERSGLFKGLPERDMLSFPTEAGAVKPRNWQVLGQEYLVIGQVVQVGQQFSVQFQLFDVYKGDQLTGYRWMVAEKDLRFAAHHISDLIYEKLTGKKGAFATRIAYITVVDQGAKQKQYRLRVADSDGYQPRTIVSSFEPLMSPAWSADGKKIAYVSFENKRSAIYIQNLADGKRVRISAFKGINGAPAFSPDGSKLAITLSKDGSPDIYLLDIQSRNLTKLTRSYAIDTEPAWSPDGRSLVYTSDQGGKPQLYQIPVSGGKSVRLTYAGDYNTRARFSADGRKIAMVHGNNGDYRIAVLDLVTRTVDVLTPGRYDESPSFAPNGDMILYAARRGTQSVLAAVSVDGRMRQNLAFENGEVREPAWSP